VKEHPLCCLTAHPLPLGNKWVLFTRVCARLRASQTAHGNVKPTI
jgi:hypothetical protein